ncbi:MAG TPA: cysteine hydrolase [Flexivirga sp.]|uniref:cysteine hydrolase family protein n=1 Tax=Flexivirga sp. TaxID=1962927 RepID=UPI002B978130|nr:cysteine hydrolase [Flexivirga sp.]HWC22134.1 cysteine hydrolase [Flexivirga sp.]
MQTTHVPAPADDWLIVIDAQAIFADPQTSQWGSPMWAEVVPRIRDAVEQYGDRVVFTRFVADPAPEGSWAAYYEAWPFAQLPDADPLYALVPELAGFVTDGTPVVTMPTFGKWSGLAEIVGPTAQLTLAGVSTDCCVLSTALAAADAGATVHVASDLCAGSTPQNHTRALAAMELYGPQITIT